MARKDDIFFSFLNHELLREKYSIEPSDIPKDLEEGFKSPDPIIKAIAIIVYNTEVIKPPVTDNKLYALLSQYLNESAI